MFRTILVPLDGSGFAEHALPLAVSVAKSCGATLRLLRVMPPLSDYFFMPPEPTDPLHDELQEQYSSEARDYLERVAQRLGNACPVFCDVIEEEEGVSESVCEAVGKAGADLIVLSSHGRGAAERFWLGSIADKLVRTAPVPVLMARPPEHSPPIDLNQPAPLRHFVIALDGATSAERIVEPARALGKLTGADYTLVRVVRPAFPGLLSAGEAMHKIDEQNCVKAENYLNAVAEGLRSEGATVNTKVDVAEQPAAAILRVAVEIGADLIALETHGRGMSRLLIGSVADKVVRGSSIPVLVCRLPNQSS